MCPFHAFARHSFCRYCWAFSGGFVGGFLGAPYRWYKGGTRMQSMGGLIGADKDMPEEAENQLIGQEIRAVKEVATSKENRENARDAWNQLPLETRTRLKESGFEALGNLGGGFAATQVVIFALNYLAAKSVRLMPRLRPVIRILPPIQIPATFILGALSVQGTAWTLMQRQRQIFTSYPGSEEAFKDVLNKTTKDKTTEDDSDIN